MAIESLPEEVANKIEEDRKRKESMVPAHITVEDDNVIVTVERYLTTKIVEPGIAELIEHPEKSLVFSKTEIRDMIANLY